MLQTVFVTLVLCLAPVLGQATEGSFTVKSYPDPITNYRACGRSSPSFVCDPSGILPEDKADAIDEELKGIFNETAVPCYTSGPRASRRRGYIVMVAVMSKMLRLHTVNISGEYNRNLRYMEAQYFSYYLGQDFRWGEYSSQCSEMVIILYSQEDGVLYTSTQSTARQLLTDDVVRDVMLSTLTRYYPFNDNLKVGNAILYMSRRYGTTLREDTAPQKR